MAGHHKLCDILTNQARYLTYARAVREISVQELPAAGIAPLLLSLPGLQTIVVRNLCAELELVGSVDGNTRGIRFTQASCFPGDVAPLLRKVNAARSAVPLDWPLDIVIDYAIAWEVEHLDVLDNFSLKHPVHINRLAVHAGADMIAFYDHLQSLPLHASAPPRSLVVLTSCWTSPNLASAHRLSTSMTPRPSYKLCPAYSGQLVASTNLLKKARSVSSCRWSCRMSSSYNASNAFTFSGTSRAPIQRTICSLYRSRRGETSRSLLQRSPGVLMPLAKEIESFESP